jgi:monovalent cation:H+ antiporter, CPA1 family
VRSVYFIASGAVELEAAGQTWRLGRGEMFGQLSILTSRRRRTEARAITPTILLVLDEARFRRLLRRSAGLRAAVLESAEKRGLAEDLTKLPEFAGTEGPLRAA